MHLVVCGTPLSHVCFRQTKIWGPISKTAGDANEPTVREASEQGDDLRLVRPHFALEAFPDVTEDVRQSISRLKNSPFLPNAESIRGFVYNVSDGSITEVV